MTDENSLSGISGINTELPESLKSTIPRNVQNLQNVTNVNVDKNVNTPKSTVAKLEQNIVFAGLAYNCETTIEALINHIIALASHFADFRFIILESNSKDQTRSNILKSISSCPPEIQSKITVLTEQYTRRIYEHAQKMKRFGIAINPNARYRKMGILRNILLREYRHMSMNFKNDYFVMMDLDIEGFFSKHAFLERIRKDAKHVHYNDVKGGQTSDTSARHASQNWDALACFGLNLHPRKKWFPCSEHDRVASTGLNDVWMYYDQLAFRDMNNQNKCQQWPSLNIYTFSTTEPPVVDDMLVSAKPDKAIVNDALIHDKSIVQDKLATMEQAEIDLNLVQVRSAFSGLCIYRSSLFQGNTIQYNEMNDANECEHVTLHARLLAHHPTFKLCVDTNLLLFYKPFPIEFCSTMSDPTVISEYHDKTKGILVAPIVAAKLAELKMEQEKIASADVTVETNIASGPPISLVVPPTTTVPATTVSQVNGPTVTYTQQQKKKPELHGRGLKHRPGLSLVRIPRQNTVRVRRIGPIRRNMANGYIK